MIHEFAIEPEALSEWNAIWQSLEQFGVPHGRLIAHNKKKWLKKVHEATKNCPPVRRRVLEERLNRLRKKMTKGAGREYNPDICWCANAAAQQESQTPFRAVIVSDDHSEFNNFLTQYDLSEANALWHVQTQKKVPRTPKEMARCVSILGKMSGNILFIDPHYDSQLKRFNEVLLEVLNQCDINGKNVKRIELHTGTKIPVGEFEQNAQKYLSPKLPEGVSIHVFRWEQQDGQEKFHARYILTEKGGLNYEVGLDSGKKGETTNVSLLAEGIYKQRWQDFQKDSSPYRLIDEFIID